jgi:hypothetical protein
MLRVDDFGGDHSAPAAFLVCVFSLYVATLYPTIPGGDAGELAAEACQLGVAHPPGYPLFTLLVHGFVSAVPFGSPGWRANLFSALCGTLCAGCMLLSVRIWTTSADGSYLCGPCITAAGLFAFSPIIWMYSTGSEVFALNNLFAAALLYCCLCYAKYKTWGLAKFGAFLCGLAMCNQHTIVLLEIPIILWVLWTQRRVLNLQKLLVLAACFLGGLLPYAYLPYAQIYFPKGGSWGDTTTFAGFFHHLRRGDYGTFKLFASDKAAAEGLQERLTVYADDLWNRESLYVAVPLAVLGMIVCLSRSVSSCDATAPTAATKADKTSTKKAGAARDKASSTSDGKRAAATAGEVDTSSVSVGALFALAYVFYMVVFHSLANMPLGEGLLFGVQVMDTHLSYHLLPTPAAYTYCLHLLPPPTAYCLLTTEFSCRCASGSSPTLSSSSGQASDWPPC